MVLRAVVLAVIATTVTAGCHPAATPTTTAITADELLEQYASGKRDFGQVDLRGAKLQGAALSEIDLSGADLSGADLSAGDLFGADLRGADLRGAILPSRLDEARLKDAILDDDTVVDPKWYLVWRISTEGVEGLDLLGADLSHAALQDLDLRGADLHGQNLFQADLSGSDLSGANLTGANLEYARLEDAVLHYAVLSGAVLRLGYAMDADLSGADLLGADLAKVNMAGADLSGTDMRSAVLTGASLDGVILTDVFGLTQEQLDATNRYDGVVGLPDGLEPDRRLEPTVVPTESPVSGSITVVALDVDSRPCKLRVDYEAQSADAPVTEMRRVQDYWYGCNGAVSRIDEGEWEPFVASEEVEASCDGDYTHLSEAVQYRDAAGALSPVYCQDATFRCSFPPTAILESIHETPRPTDES